jgi:hypothetical protein
MSDIVRDNQLDARTNLKGVELVRMGETKFLPLVKGNKYGSYGFDSCIGVLIYGKEGALIGHYSCSAHSIADSGPLGGADVNPAAATHAIPAALHGQNLGAGIKSYIFAQEGTAQERITELTNVITAQHLPAPKVKMYKQKTGDQGAGFIVDVGKFLGTSHEWQFS